jgi:hypothetical protein
MSQCVRTNPRMSVCVHAIAHNMHCGTFRLQCTHRHLFSRSRALVSAYLRTYDTHAVKIGKSVFAESALDSVLAQELKLCACNRCAAQTKMTTTLKRPSFATSSGEKYARSVIAKRWHLSHPTVQLPSFISSREFLKEVRKDSQVFQPTTVRAYPPGQLLHLCLQGRRRKGAKGREKGLSRMTKGCL